jgi:putative ABC transport system permease protein
MEGIRADVAYAFRSVVRRPWFAVLTGGILSVTVAANAAIFSVVKSVLIDGLPVAEPDRLVGVWLRSTQTGQPGRMTPGRYTDVARLDVFEGQAAFGAVSATLLGRGEPRVVHGGRVTSGYFEVLGVRPVLGRSFRPGEDAPDEAPVVILSDRLWTQLGGDPSIVGQAIDFDGTRFEVVGVLPPGLYPASATLSAEFPFTADNQDFFVPLRYPPELWRNRRPHVLGMVARLRPGQSTENAAAVLETLAARVATEDPVAAGESYLLRPFREEVTGNVRFGLLMLMGTVGLVLAIAAVNVAALFVLRSDDRQQELAVRTAIGASRMRLLRQLAVESVFVTAAGVGAGILLSLPLVGAMQRMVPFQIPRLGDARVDRGVIVATLAIGGLLAVAFGVASAVGATRSHATRGPTRTRGMAGRPGRTRLQASTVAVQAALAVVVLMGATLLMRSFVALRAVDPGFDATDAWVIQLGGSSPVIDQVLERLRALPGVRAAAVGYDHPLERNWDDTFGIEDAIAAPDGQQPFAALRIAGDDWFEAAGISVLEGRVPDPVDAAGSRGVAVINRALADRYFPDGDAIGRRIAVPTAQRMFGEYVPEWFDVIGVVANVRFLGPEAADEPALYLPAAQFPATTARLLVRPAGRDPAFFAAVRAAIRDVDPDLPLDDARRMDAILDDMLARPRFNMAILAAFAIVGLTLCAMGIYGLVSRVVLSRGREIGIRAALGATPGAVAIGLLSFAAVPVLCGIAVGLVVAIGGARLIRSLLFGITSGDPVTLVSVPAFVLLVALLASIGPTLRALRIDPMVALRDD